MNRYEIIYRISRQLAGPYSYIVRARDENHAMDVFKNDARLVKFENLGFFTLVEDIRPFKEVAK